MYRRPIITLHGANGDSITFDGVGDQVTLKPGTTGTGLAPVELTHVGLPQGGAFLQHKRWDKRTLTFPLDVHTGDYGELEKLRRRFEALVSSGPTDIEVFSEVYGSRWITADYRSGLEGEFSWAKKITSQPLLLEFEAADPFFYGDEIEQSVQLSPPEKPFLSGVSDGAQRVNLAPAVGAVLPDGNNVSSETTTGGGPADGEAVEVWADDGELRAKLAHITPSHPVDGRQYQQLTFSFQIKGSIGITHANIVVIDTVSGRRLRERTVRVTDGWQKATITSAGLTPQMEVTVVVTPRRSVGGVLSEPQPGERLHVADVLVEPGPRSGEYFDGDTVRDGYSFGWLLDEGGPSVARAEQKSGYAPFFPIILGSSSLDYTYTARVMSDETVHAIAIVTGPATDATITNGDKSLTIKGEIRDKVTIDSRPTVYDVFTDSGEVWDIVEGDPSVLHLEPGENQLQVSAVGATRQSSIRLLYRPRYRAGH